LERSTVRVTDLTKTYLMGDAEVHALAGVSFDVPEGQFLCIRGRSGSGKSTLLHIIGGLQKPSAGEVWIGQTEMSALSRAQSARFRRRRVGVIFQFFNLIPTLNIEQNIALPLLLDGFKLRQVRDRVDELIEDLGLSHRRDLAPQKLSGGEMQRVAIARALIVEPDVILADEPTGNLDHRTSHEIFGLLRDLSHSNHVTTIVVTHDLETTSYADRLIVLDDGRVLEDTDDATGAAEGDEA
jgi:putative ABC transport system ATP-binding protein